MWDGGLMVGKKQEKQHQHTIKQITEREPEDQVSRQRSRTLVDLTLINEYYLLISCGLSLDDRLFYYQRRKKKKPLSMFCLILSN